MTIAIAAGYAGFHAAINVVSQGMGGDPNVRRAVGYVFEEALRGVIKTRLGLSSHYDVDWHQAVYDDMTAASQAAMAFLGRPMEEGRCWEAEFRGGRICAVGLRAYIVGKDTALLIAMGSFNEFRISGGKAWSAHITHEGKIATRAWGSSHVSSTNAASEEGAQRAVRRLVETFFRVNLEERR
jgi:hypothetical protein